MIKYFKLKIVFLIVLHVIKFTSIKTDECQDLLFLLFKNLNPMDLSNPLNSSGTGLGNMGDYEICKSEKTNKYILYQFKTEHDYPINKNFSFYTGFCLPEICTTDENLEKIKSKLSEIFNIKAEDIKVIETEKENEKFIHFNAATIIILFIISIYLLFATGLLKFIIDSIFTKHLDAVDKSFTKFGKNELNKNKRNHKNTNDSLTKSKDSDDLNYGERKYSSRKQTDVEEHEKKNSLLVINKDESIQSFVSQKVYEYSIFENFFDITKNLKTIFLPREEYSKSSPELKIFDGFKAFIYAIIIFSTFTEYLRKMPLRNPEIAYDYCKSFFMQIFLNPSFAYEALFAISGFLVAYSHIGTKLEKQGISLKMTIKTILLKFIRIWPVYSLVFLIYWKFLVYVMDGPLSGFSLNKELESCNNQWPFVLMMISNLTFGLWENTTNFCMSWGWFIQNDFIYCIIGIILMAVYSKSKKLFWSIFTILFLAFIAIEGWLIWIFDLGVNIIENESNINYYKSFYYKFYTRISPFLIGMMFGILYANYKNSLESSKFSSLGNMFYTIQNSRFLTGSSYILGLVFIFTYIFAPFWNFEHEWNFTKRFVYNFLGNKVFTVGLFSFLLPLILGNLYFLGGWLQSGAFYPISKLSISAYLLHPLLIEYFFYNLEFSIFFSLSYYFITGVSFWGGTYIFSLISRLLLEMPFIHIRNSLILKIYSHSKYHNLIEEGNQHLRENIIK